MIERVIAAALLLAAVLGGGLLARRETVRLCGEMGALLLEDELEEAVTVWNEGQLFFSFVVSHDRVDNLSQTLARAAAFRRAGTMDEYRAEVQDALLQLILLREYDRPGLRSIF